MNESAPALMGRRFRWEWAACAGLALALVALWMWIGAGTSGRVVVAWLVLGALFGIGLWLERQSVAVRRYGHLLIAGSFAGFFGSTCAGYAQHPPGIFHAWILAFALLAAGAAALVWVAGRYASAWLGTVGLGLMWLGVTLQQFTVFSLAASLLLVAIAVHFYRRQGWILPVWLLLIALPAGFVLGWPFSDGRLDQDRYLELTEYWWTLVFFVGVWAVLLHIASTSTASTFTAPRRLFFATLNNAALYFLGVLILPQRYPDWYWKFTFAAGGLFLVAWALTDRYPALRRAFAVHGTLLVALGIASSVIGRQPSAMLAVASAFFVLSVEQRGQWLLRYCAGLTALFAVALAVEPIFGSEELGRGFNRIPSAFGTGWESALGNYEPSLWLGVFVGAPLVFASIWISRQRALWRRWAVLFFGALGLGTWLLTTLAQTPAQHHPPILAVEAVLVTASILLLGIAEYPLLATSVLLLAQFLWFEQVGNFNARPWWNPLIVVLCTLGLSWWWQTRGRALVSERALRWGQGVAALAAVAILLLSIESAFGRSGTALFALSLLAVSFIAYASLLRDWLLFGFAQLFVATAVGEFIGQLTSAPLPGWIAPLAPIGALLVIAPMLRSPFTASTWEEPARWVALLYRVLAAAMFVVWVLHYISPPNRFLVLALVAVALVFRHLQRLPGGSLLGGIVCAVGALLTFWMSWGGGQGFRLRDLLAFLLLLGFGQILRRKQLLPDELQTIGILLGLAAVTQWVENWIGFHHPGVPVSVVWAIVAAVIVCVGWWLNERLYRVFGWVLLLAALGRTVWMDFLESNLPLGTDPAFRLGLLAVGLAALVAALGYARRPAITGK